MAVLIIEDSVSMRALITGIIEDMGLQAVPVASGEAALDYVTEAEKLPSVVLQDIGLPGIDGYETATQLKTIAASRHLPIIFLTGASDTDVLGKCLAIGDDYICKPFSVDLVSSKVSAHHRVSQLYQQLERQYAELKHHQHRVALEHDIVETIFANHFDDQFSGDQNFRAHLSPASVFNGDVLLTAMGPTGNRYVAIGDVTGHGLPAAVGALPVYQTFRTMAAKGLGVGIIAAEMNSALNKLLPDNMMMATTLLELNAAGDRLAVWSGGLPAMILADAKGNIKQLIESSHCPLAMLLPHEFSQDIEIYNTELGDRIYLFTDGVEESRNSQGEMFGEQRLHQLFDGSDGNVFDRIFTQLEEFTGDQQQDDDITLVELVCEAADRSALESVREKPDLTALPWSLQYQLGVDEIRLANPVPQIIRLLGNAAGLDVHQDYLSTVLSELYGNALEHGLLRLDSKVKRTEDGFMEYYQLRNQRLEALREGSIDIKINYHQHSASPKVEMIITDTGSGFDVDAVNSHESDESFGRGMQIVRELCDSVTYSDGGRCVTTVYLL